MIDGTGTADISQITSFTGSTLTASGGSSSFGSLTNANYTNFEYQRQRRGDAPSPKPATPEAVLRGVTSTLEASGAGSLLLDAKPDDAGGRYIRCFVSSGRPILGRRCRVT